MPTDGLADSALGVEASDVIIAGALLHGEGGLEALPHVGERHAILGPLGSSHAGLDGAEVELEELVEYRCGRFVGAEHALLPGVALDQVDQLAVAPGRLEVA